MQGSPRKAASESLCPRPSAGYTYVGTVDADLDCSICLHLLVDPAVHASCGNMFCGTCLKDLTECPLCRGGLESSAVTTAPLFVRNKLSALLVVCELCHRTMGRGEISAHLSGCKGPTVPCAAADLGCKAQFTVAEKTGHEHSCPLVAVKPLVEDLRRENKEIKQAMVDLEQKVCLSGPLR